MTQAKQITANEFTHLRALASAFQRPRLVQSWIKTLQLNGEVSIPFALYASLPASQKRDVDVVLNDLPFDRKLANECLTLSSK